MGASYRGDSGHVLLILRKLVSCPASSQRCGKAVITEALRDPLVSHGRLIWETLTARGQEGKVLRIRGPSSLWITGTARG